FVTRRERPRRERGSFFSICGHNPGHKMVWHVFSQKRGSTFERLFDEGIAVQKQNIKEKRRDRQLLAQSFDVKLAPKSPHRRLKWLRRAVPAKREHFAVEDYRARGNRAARRDHLWNGARHVTQISRVDANLVARFVHLDPRSIQLVFERGLTEFI